MGEEKAKKYQNSGENLTALLLTLAGIDEIWNALKLGKSAFKTAGAINVGILQQVQAAVTVTAKQRQVLVIISI
jgi:hypothetical protein